MLNEKGKKGYQKKVLKISSQKIASWKS